MDRIETHSPAPPVPATARPNIKKPTEGAIAQNKLPISKMTILARNTVFGAEIARTLPKKRTNAA